MDQFQKAAWMSLVERIGPRLSGATFDNYQVGDEPAQAMLVDKLREVAANPAAMIESGGGLVLIGTMGTGKDHLSFCVASAVFKAGFSVAWENGEELFAAARDAMGSRDTEYQTARRYTQPDLLWLSDPLPPKGLAENSGNLTDWQMRFLYLIVDYRYRHKKPTIVTANAHDLMDFDRRIGLQVADRLNHGSVRFLCKWPSFRTRNR